MKNIVVLTVEIKYIFHVIFRNQGSSAQPSTYFEEIRMLFYRVHTCVFAVFVFCTCIYQFTYCTCMYYVCMFTRNKCID